MLKAQHPEFELWSQGIHARSGVACADCHMPYMREGATKVTDHWVRSPLLNVNRACQTCHRVPEAELQARVDAIQDRTHALMQRVGGGADRHARRDRGGQEGRRDAPSSSRRRSTLQRKAQWRLDFIAAENSMGFHAPQEAARILGRGDRLRAPGPARGADADPRRRRRAAPAKDAAARALSRGVRGGRGRAADRAAPAAITWKAMQSSTSPEIAVSAAIEPREHRAG